MTLFVIFSVSLALFFDITSTQIIRLENKNRKMALNARSSYGIPNADSKKI